MCSLEEYAINQGKQLGIQEGIKEGIKEGIESTMMENLRCVMNKMNMTLEEAMIFLNVKAQDKKKYMQMML